MSASQQEQRPSLVAVAGGSGALGGGLTLHMQRVLGAPRAAVFRALSEPQELVKWFGPAGFSIPGAESDLRAGGRYRIAMQPAEGDLFYLAGEFLEVDPPEQLSYTFCWEDPDPEAATRATQGRLDSEPQQA